jgi:hypothetical protein
MFKLKSISLAPSTIVNNSTGNVAAYAECRSIFAVTQRNNFSTLKLMARFLPARLLAVPVVVVITLTVVVFLGFHIISFSIKYQSYF